MSMTVDPNQRFVSPLQGIGLSLFVVSIVGGVSSLIVVGLRTYHRLRQRNFSLDDALMLGGLIIYLADVVLACVGALSGLGRRNAELNPTMMSESLKYLMMWLLLYVAALCLVKSSICVTTLRIATTMPRLRIAVYVLLGLTIATFLTTFIGLLMMCRPVEANWNLTLVAEGRAECAPLSVMMGLSYTSTSSTIATDLACAVLPAIILWRTQMKLSTKILCFDIDNDHMVNLPIWSNIETAVGLVAGSLPALRQLFMRDSAKGPSTRGTEGSGGLHPASAGLVTIGGSGGTSKSKIRKGLKSNFEIDEAAKGDWTRLDEDSVSDKDSTVPIRGIRRDMTFEVEMSPQPGHNS
ncbi:hypothetical protein CTA1_10211 [Colletotrichum tanaceti]|uniref:Rhodopsin domain-containing protein n=1 Tax=Colletotrichum tanaceti TaxID=1306861 RepID=A0A4U6XU24_9PEZI|nr:hypothetical protein CTA1_10211 [Colletotrichum tanaceti]